MPWAVAAAAIGVGGSLLSGSMQSSAASDAADTQAEANKYAADIEKQIFEQQRSDLAPWRAAGSAALNEITALNGLAPPTAGTTTYTPGTTIPGTATNPQSATNQPRATDMYGRIAQLIAQQDGKKVSANPLQTYVTTPGQTVTTPGQTSAQQQQAALDRFHVSPGYQFSFDQGQQAVENSAAARGGVHSGATMKALDRFGTGLANQEYGDYYNRLAAQAGVGQTAVNSGNQAAQNYGNSAAQLAQNTGAARASAYGQAGQAWSNAYGGVASSINGGIGNYLYMSQAASQPAGTFQPVQITPQVSAASYGL